MNFDFLICPNYLQYEQAMSADQALLDELLRLKMLEKAGTIRPRDEAAQPGPETEQRQPLYDKSGYVKTAHIWKKDGNNNLTGYCLHEGCGVHCAAANMPVNCVGNSKYKVENGIVTTETKSGTGVYTRKVL